MTKVLISVINDLATDQRMDRTARTLQEKGFEVLLIGRKLKNSPPLSRPYSTKRMNLLFTRGPLFYATYNIRLFLFLLFHKADAYLSVDLDTLPANYLASLVKNKALVFDSHEYFSEVPELVHRPFVKKIWLKLEQWMVPKLTYAYTVSDSIATMYKQKYNINFLTIRNLPYFSGNPGGDQGNASEQSEGGHQNQSSNQYPLGHERPAETQSIQGAYRSQNHGHPISSFDAVKSEIPTGHYVIIYQGALNMGRGLENLIRAMTYLDNYYLLLAGGGDLESALKELSGIEQVENKVCFTGRIIMEELFRYTQLGDIGVSLEEDLGLNYRYAMPNKLFAYIQSHLPVLVSNLPEMAYIVKKYDIGLVNHHHEPMQMALDIKLICEDEEKRKNWKANLAVAASELCWEKEEQKLVDLFEKIKHDSGTKLTGMLR